MGYLYVLAVKCNLDSFKIGITTNPKKRLRTFQTANANEVIYLRLFYCSNYEELEVRLHNIFENQQKRGEWFMTINLQSDLKLIDSFITRHSEL